MQLTWRGEVYSFAPGDQLKVGPLSARVFLFAPAPDRPWLHPTLWIADTPLPGTGRYADATGDTPQAALDALDAILPAAPLSRGGLC